jgi:hypothetical protein
MTSVTQERSTFFNAMKALIARHVLPGYEKGSFKLTCDDFQPTNMIANNEHELKIVGVLDLEWSYTAPS